MTCKNGDHRDCQDRFRRGRRSCADLERHLPLWYGTFVGRTASKGDLAGIVRIHEERSKRLRWFEWVGCKEYLKRSLGALVEQFQKRIPRSKQTTVIVTMHALSLLSGLALVQTAFASPVVTRQCNGPNVNAATVALIKEFEGFVPSSAPDPIGLPTVGYGHLCQTSGCSEVPYSFPLTQTTASQLLASDLKVCKRLVVSAQRLQLTQWYRHHNRPSHCVLPPPLC